MTFALSFAAAVVLTPLVIALVHRWQLIDVPNLRSSHSAPVPRGGGIAVIGASLASVLVTVDWVRPLVALVVGAIVLGVTGFVDDRSDLPALPRLMVQLATPVVAGVLVADRLTPWLVLAAVVVAGYVNAFNFMDGINGISGSQAAIAGAFLALVAENVGEASLVAAGWAVCGASLGFLPFNAVRAWIFLGDVGSYFLGFWLAGLALLLVDAGAPVVVVIGPFLLYLLDTSSVLVRRARRGERLTEAHREHAYQLLTQLGWSHTAVSALCEAVSAVCAAMMFAVIESTVVLQLAGLGASAALVIGYLALPALMSGRRADQVVT